MRMRIRKAFFNSECSQTWLIVEWLREHMYNVFVINIMLTLLHQHLGGNVEGCNLST